MIRIALLLALVAALAACGPDGEAAADGTPAPSAPLLGTKWVVTGLVDDRGTTAVPAGVDAYLVFADDRLTGSGGCNRLSAPLTFPADGRVEVGPVITTKMACGDVKDATERSVLAVLRGGLTVTLAGDTMRISGAGNTGLVLRAG